MIAESVHQESDTDMSEYEYKVPKKMRDKYDAIVEITDAISEASLNAEYADLAREMTAALSRKRPSPLERGQTASWAAGVLYALGQVNFLFDSTDEPYMPATELCDRAGVSQSTGQSKARTIRDALGTNPLDPDWSLPSTIEDNPLAWTIMVNGMVVDARKLPREIQEEAHRKGLIPHVPGAEGS
jgi:hypothetical protein